MKISLNNLLSHENIYQRLCKYIKAWAHFSMPINNNLINSFKAAKGYSQFLKKWTAKLS